jgi:hypothetical protein
MRLAIALVECESVAAGWLQVETGQSKVVPTESRGRTQSPGYSSGLGGSVGVCMSVYNERSSRPV